MRKEMLVLAKSAKQSGVCLAGVEITTDGYGRRTLTHNWLRPVTRAESGACTGPVPRAWCEGVQVLDIVECELEAAEPVVGQPENYLLSSARIHKEHNLSNLACLPDLLGSLCVPHRQPWLDHRVPECGRVLPDWVRDQADPFSLMLVQPRDLTFYLSLRAGPQGTRRLINASFRIGEREYTNIRVTDPALSRVFCNQFPQHPAEVVERRLIHGDAYSLTLSLSPEFHGYHYMLVAAVIDHTGYLNRTYSA